MILPPDSAERTNEINQLVLALRNGSIDEQGLERLALICQARPVREEEEVASKLNRDFWTKDDKVMKIFDGLKTVLSKTEVSTSSQLAEVCVDYC